MTAEEGIISWEDAPAGHLVKVTEGGYSGERGPAYNYIMAGNGLFVEAENPLMKLRILVSPAEVRGLPREKELVQLEPGRIHPDLLEEAITRMRDSREAAGELTELYLEVRADGGGSYALYRPLQEGNPAGVNYQREEDHSLVMEMHSHGREKAFFSATDDRDEQGFGLYLVAGKVDRTGREVLMRAGIYGHFRNLPVEAAFGDGATER